MKKLHINMLSKGQDVKGQGVGSAFYELVDLLKEYASDTLEVSVNGPEPGDINHFHTIDPSNYFKIKMDNSISVMYCHFLPETLEGSISLPKPAFEVFSMYFLDFYKTADYLVVVNPIFIDRLVEYNIDRKKIVYIPNYVSKQDFYILDEASKQSVRHQYNLDAEAFIVLGVGQVQTRKGVIDFVEVAKQNPDMTFVWAGGFSFGAITDGYQQLKQIVENPPANVVFLDIVPREEMNGIFNMADVLFMPSYNELFPMAILEAVNTATPLLLRDLDLYRDILFKYICGENNNDFSYYLRKLKNDPEFYEIVSNFSTNISEFYSKENVGQQWVDFYQRIYDQASNHEISMFWEGSSFEKLRSQKATAIVDGSNTNGLPFGEISVNDHILIKASNKRLLRARVSEIHTHENFYDEEAHLDFLLSFQSKLRLDGAQIKKFSNKNYLQILVLDDFEDLSEL